MSYIRIPYNNIIMIIIGRKWKDSRGNNKKKEITKRKQESWVFKSIVVCVITIATTTIIRVVESLKVHYSEHREGRR